MGRHRLPTGQLQAWDLARALIHPAAMLGIGESTASADWAYAKAWLRVELAAAEPNSNS